MVVISVTAQLHSRAPAVGNGQAGGATRGGSTDSSRSDLSNGRRLFLRDCSRCHGVNGDGTSPIRRTLHPAPLDLTSFTLSENFILDTLHNGVPGSDMPAWHSSPEHDLRAISAYTSRLSRADALPENEFYAPTDSLHEAGRRVYVTHCARCHGDTGGGDGPDAARYRPAPPSFQSMQPSYDMARRIIETGVRGTAMPSWPLLTPPEIQAVTYYVRSLYAGDGNESPTARTATP